MFSRPGVIIGEKSFESLGGTKVRPKSLQKAISHQKEKKVTPGISSLEKKLFPARHYGKSGTKPN